MALGFSLLASFDLCAQSVDFKSRIGAELEYDLSKDATVSLNLQGRFRGNSSIFEKVLAEPSFSYDLGDWRVGASWRAELRQSMKKKNSFRNRASAYLRYKFDVEDFRFKLKSTLQYGIDDISSWDNGNKLVDRNSVEVSYNWFGKKITPFAEYEIHTHLNNANGVIVNGSRYTLGGSYRIKKERVIELFYMFENEMNVVEPHDSHNIGLIFNFSL